MRRGPPALAAQESRHFILTQLPDLARYRLHQAPVAQNIEHLGRHQRYSTLRYVEPLAIRGRVEADARAIGNAAALIEHGPFDAHAAADLYSGQRHRIFDFA